VRADRLLALLMFLQNRGRTTTDRLAEELEVSRRTVIRDLYALRVAGFPVYTERGPGGGVYLHQDFRMKLTDLTHDEVAALFALNVPAPLADLGMGAEAKGALLKLAAAQPAARRGVERDVRSRLYLDPDPWNASRVALPTLSALRRAVWEDRWARTTFLRAHLVPIEREIAPHGLVAKGTRWYVVWRGRDGELRVDRVAAALGAELLDEQFERPPGFDLQEFWTTWASAYEASRPFFRAVVRVRSDVLSQLEHDLGRHVERAGAAQPDSPHVEMEMTFDDFEQARALLLSCGGAVEVLDPPALRLSLVDYAEQITRRYAG
jgi:predicted DNA-binding transcriptional regulator YafY